MTRTIDVACERGRADRWTCRVTVGDGGRELSIHTVTVSAADLARLAPDASDPTDLVERSFAFLLAREPPETILRSFDVSVIRRYFPEYEDQIGGRVEPG